MIKNIFETLNKFAPENVIETTYSPKSASWITNKIKNAKRNKMFHKWIAERTIEIQTRYKQIRIKVTNLISGKKDDNFKKLGKNPNSNMIYRILRTRKRKDNANELPDVDDLNDYFVSIGPKLSAKFNNKKSCYNIRNNDKATVLHQTNESEVTKILKKLKNKKSTGHDGISNDILKCCSPIIDRLPARAINYCLLERIFPDSL